jgi:hypothetical protein
MSMHFRTVPSPFVLTLSLRRLMDDEDSDAALGDRLHAVDLTMCGFRPSNR